jgi:phage repressor protein C with HTH and peptisase S24 domain
MRTTIQERLKEVRKDNYLTQAQAAEKIGLSSQAWNSAEGGKSNFSRKNLEKIARTFGINLTWLFSGEGSKTGETLTLKNIHNRKLVKLLSGSVLAGLVEGFTPENIEIEDQIYIPGIKSKKDCYAIRVEGDSMEPEIKAGAIVILEPMEQRSEFQDEKEYVVIAEGVALLKKVSIILSGKDKGKFVLSSYNEEKVKVVEEGDIVRWYRVIYVISGR